MRKCKELKRISRENLAGNYKEPMGALIYSTLIAVVIDLPFSNLMDKDFVPLHQKCIYYFAEILILILSGVLQIGMTKLHLEMARGKKYSIGQIFYCFKNQSDHYFLGCICLTALEALALAPGILGCFFVKKLAVLIPLIILSIILFCGIVVCYNFTYYVLLDNEELSVKECISKARKLIKGHIFKLIYVYLSFIGLEILSLLSLGIGLLWVEPYRLQTMANFYLDVTNGIPHKPFNQYV